MKVTPVILLILDGFGYREDSADNAIAAANKPNWDRLWKEYAHTTIKTSELSVGLPEGQMGNSEVGHLNIGAGRVVYQELTRINLAIRDGSFFANPALSQAVETARRNDKTLHIMGLLSDGGVHSHQDHIFAMMKMAVEKGVKRVCVHAFLDGRDTPPRSADAFIAALQAQCDQLGDAVRIASVSGRYYSMDRDKRWERTQAGYDLLTLGRAEFAAATAAAALNAAYARGENDEFVKPTVVGQPAPIKDGDVVLYMNFRADRARQMCQALMQPDFDGFPRAHWPRLGGLFTLTSYSDDFAFPVAYPPQKVRNGFGEYIASLGLKQLRIAETEKYAHVTFFFNGGEEQTYPGEERIMVQSPKVATYDMQPEMSAREVTDKLVEAILARKFDAIICNYANGDMVGHTGIMPAAIKAVEVLDECVGRVVSAMQEIGGEVLISADHGNCEMMADPATHQPHTAHTMGPVPLLYIGRPARMVEGGALQDVTPTLLKLMGVPQPAEMTGKPLVEFA